MASTQSKNEQVIQNLLTQMYGISKKYEEIAKITGENFNVFRVLKIHSDEVKMHSALIGELLNPNGSHGQGDVFFKLFLKHYNNVAEKDGLNINDFHLNGTKIEVEKYIGEKTETEGGRIDLLITDGKGKMVIIENKIYAGDQENQLIRYYNFGKKTANLCYLTLDGKLPSDGSIKNKATNLDITKQIVCLSYKEHIITWLEDCMKESVKHATLRETISQYINLIKHLTNQTTNHIMEKEIMDLILKGEENINMAMKLADSGDSIKKAILAKLLESLNDIKDVTGFNLVHFSKDKPIGYPESILRFGRTPNDKFNIAVEFENWEHLDIGICRNDGVAVTDEIKNEIYKLMASSKFENPKQSENWPWYARYKAWDDSSWWSVSNGDFKRVLYEDIKYIGEVTDSLLN